MIFKVVCRIFENICSNKLEFINFKTNIYFQNKYFKPLENFVCEENTNISGIEWVVDLQKPSYLFDVGFESKIYFLIINELKTKADDYDIYLYFSVGYAQTNIQKLKISKGIIKYLNLQDMPLLHNFNEIIIDQEGEIFGCGFLDITNMSENEIRPYLMTKINDIKYFFSRTIMVLPKNVSNSENFKQWLTVTPQEISLNNVNSVANYAIRNRGLSIDRYADWHIDDPFYSFIGVGDKSIVHILKEQFQNKFIELNLKE